ncbi:uncharacterized protein btla isoform 2-T2 [Pholidichthys leucotaenia]
MSFLSIMRPYRCWTVLLMSILAELPLTLSTNSKNPEDDCSAGILVRRNTVYEASIGKELKINCRVTFCNSSPPSVVWYKLLGNNSVPVNISSDIKTEWKTIKPLGGIYFLIFKNIDRSDSGSYLCKAGGSVSHYIRVVVNDSLHSPNNTTAGFWTYVYCAAGIASFVIIVIVISVISMRGCKEKPKKKSQTENQYMAIPMAEQHFPQPSRQALPRQSPSVPPSQRSARRKSPSRQPHELTSPGDYELSYGQIRKSRQRQRDAAHEEVGAVVYAALNHDLPQRAARPQRPPETSEYAAIRVA